MADKKTKDPGAKKDSIPKKDTPTSVKDAALKKALPKKKDPHSLVEYTLNDIFRGGNTRKQVGRYLHVLVDKVVAAVE